VEPPEQVLPLEQELPLRSRRKTIPSGRVGQEGLLGKLRLRPRLCSGNKMNFNYSQWPDYCKKNGLVWIPEWVENFDQLAKAHGYTQAQVDIAIQAHLVQIKHLFTPTIYTFKQRIALAFHFLFRRKL
jgi:hypothetical protein